MKKCTVWLPMILVLGLVPVVGCPPASPDPQTPRRRSGGDPSAGATLSEVNRVYRMATLLRAKTLGKPRQVTLQGGQKVWTVLLQQTRWTLKHMVQSAMLSLKRRTQYMKLPEAERKKHMRRIDNHVQLWWVDRSGAGAPAGLKRSLAPTTGSHVLHREVAFLGTDDRVAWFAYAPIPVWLKLQRSQKLQGGDARIPALIRGITVKDPNEATALGCYYLLAKVGLKAKDAVEKLIRTKHPARVRAVFALGRERGPEVLAWLLKVVKSTDPKVAFQARRRLLYPPRKEATALYLKWLDQGAGKRSVWREMRACAMLEVKGAAPLLPRVMARPHNLAEYRQAFVLGRKLAGKPIDEALLKIKQRIIGAGRATGSQKPDRDVLKYGVSRLAKAKDRQAAAHIGLDLALLTSKGNVDATRRAGVTILRRIRGRRGRALVRRLVKTCQDAGDRQVLQALLVKINKR